jgi:hypothetical protein
MKILSRFIMAFTLIFMISCDKDENLDETNILSKTVDIKISNNKSSKNSTNSDIELTGNIVFKMDDEKEEFLGFELSENLIKATGLTKEELSELIYSEININPDGSSKSLHSKNYRKAGGISECKSDCHKRYTDENGKKINGRGWCKFGCYVDAVVEVALKMLPTLVK